MKLIIKTLFTFSLLIFLTDASIAQESQLTKKYKTESINKLSQLMNDFYIFPDVAKKTETHLLKQLKEGHFDNFKTDEDFADALTKSVQSINKDKHMRIMVQPPFEAPEQTPERMLEEQLHRLSRTKKYNYGFHNVKIMDGNVGYLDLRGFAGVHSGKPMADAYMKLMANADAIIIDLSKNGGGDPSMVQYLCSYFFGEKVHLNSLYFRERDETIDFWTLEEVDGKKMPDVPLFVITGEKTFSGAEEFSYNMQTQKRATLVGQTSGGGANPGGSQPISETLTAFIPTGMAINPITKTNWEGVGVIPEIKTTVEESLNKTHELAKVAADKYRTELKEKHSKMYRNMLAQFETYQNEKSEAAIFKALKECSAAGLVQEWNINGLGYEYLLQKKKPKIAIAIFESNTVLHPNSANVFDSYAEALMMQGNLKLSQKNYQKAVDIATKNEDRDVQLFKDNLAKIKEKIKAEN